ncbi:hypothetical protein ACHAXS_010887, partial [Conticribra weissflogii]
MSVGFAEVDSTIVSTTKQTFINFFRRRECDFSTHHRGSHACACQSRFE